MMKLSIAALAAILASASAFVPSQQQKTTVTKTQLKADLWGKPPGDNNKEMSKALPFVPRPKLLDGSLPGDVGFE